MQFMNYILSKTINEFDLKKCQSEHEFKTDAIYPANRESSRSYEQMIIVIFNKGIFFLKFFNHFLNVTCFWMSRQRSKVTFPCLQNNKMDVPVTFAYPIIIKK